MENLELTEIILGSIFSILCVIITVVIKKSNENIFFSMRSSNLMFITNILIFFGFITYILNDILYEKIEESFKYFFMLYFVFQISIFFALVLRYFRLYISCKNPEDDNVQFNIFEPKSYHYEYFYVRLLAIFIFGILVITIIIFFAVDNKFILANLEILINNNFSDIDKCYYYLWIVFSFCQTIVFLTLFLLIETTNLNPNVHISLEIFLVSLINYIYSLSMLLSIFDDITNIDNIKTIVNIIPLIYNFLIYFVVIILPFLYGIFNNTVIIYDLPGELCTSLYLFLTKEKCFDAFYRYLKYGDSGKISIRDQNNEKNLLFLNLLISIFKYRLLVNNKASPDLIRDEVFKIKNNYLQRIIDNKYTDLNLKKTIVEETINSCNKELTPFRSNLFDKVAGVVYQILNNIFVEFKKKNEFLDLQRELKEETNIRCKLANFGLIRN